MTQNPGAKTDFMKRGAIFLFLCLGFMFWNGCQTFEDTQFAPLEPRLGRFKGGGMQYIVLVNTSGKELNNVSIHANMWGENDLVETRSTFGGTGLPDRDTPHPFYLVWGSDSKISPGEVIHFRDRYLGGESIFIRLVYKVQIIGKCDEGRFRETWVIGNTNQFRLADAPRN